MIELSRHCVHMCNSEMYEIYCLNIYYDRLYTNVSIYLSFNNFRFYREKSNIHAHF